MKELADAALRGVHRRRVVLVAAGAEAPAVLPLIGCALMMGAMAWMMMRGGGGS